MRSLGTEGLTPNASQTRTTKRCLVGVPASLPCLIGNRVLRQTVRQEDSRPELGPGAAGAWRTIVVAPLCGRVQREASSPEVLGVGLISLWPNRSSLHTSERSDLCSMVSEVDLQKVRSTQIIFGSSMELGHALGCSGHATTLYVNMVRAPWCLVMVGKSP